MSCFTPSLLSYYQGHPGWAPIMGVGYYQTLVQWSKGEYALANNTQDDLAVMTGSYGITYRNDDHSNAISGATPMTVVSSTTVTGKGIIERTTDTDYLSFQTGAGTVSFTVTGNPRDANLDVQAKLFDASGTQIVLNNPTGLSASFTTTLAAGTYYLAIDGVGSGDLTTGYSDYGSLGEFNISGTIVSPTATVPSAPTSLAAVTTSASQINLTWTDASNNENGFKLERSLNNSTWTLVANPGANVTSYSDINLTASTLYYYRIRANNNAGDSANSNVAQATTLVTTPAAPTSLVATAASSSQINLSWADASSNETGFKVERSTDTATWTLVTTTGANVVSYSNTGLTASTLYYFRVRATNSAGDSANSNVAQTTTQAAVSSSTMHIGDIDHTKSTARNGTWGATMTVTVHKSGDAILPNATVSGSWSNGTTGSCTAGAKGTCTISKTGLASTTTSITFTVTNVVLSGYTYAAASNHDPDGSSNGTTVTVAK